MAQPQSFIEAAPSLAHALDRALLVFDTRPLFGTIQDATESQPERKVVYSTALQVRNRAARIASSLCRQGLARRSTLAICMENCPEWILLDFAGAFCDFVVVGLQTTWPKEEIGGVLEDAEVDALVCEPSVAAALADGSIVRPATLKHVFVKGTDTGTAAAALRAQGVSAMALSDLEQPTATSELFTWTGAGVNQSTTAPSVSDDAVDSSQAFSLIYSSGTSGRPKAIVVSKARWKTDQLSGIGQSVSPSVTVIHQALAHGCDRGICWQAALSGGQVVFVRRTHRELLQDMAVVRPTYLMAMSHFWALLHSECLAEATTAARAIVLGNLAATDFDKPLLSGDGATNLLDSAEGQHAVAALLASTAHPAHVMERACRNVRKQTGGRLDVLITGGSFTSRAVLRWMKRCFDRPDDDENPFEAVMVKNAYGTTEFPGISVDGEISPLVDLELVDIPELGYSRSDKPFPRGEIKVRNKNGSLSSYWKRPEENAKAFRDGWYHTGDIGMIDDEGLLHIIDRKQSLIELYRQGRSVWVAFAELEQLFLASPAIDQLFLFGDRNEAALLAGVVLNDSWLEAWCAGHNLPACTVDKVLAVKTTRVLLEQNVLETIVSIGTQARRADHELPAGVVIASTPWTAENGMATAVGKLKRGVLCKRYKHQFDQIYATFASQPEAAVPSPSVNQPMSLTAASKPLAAAPPTPLLEQLRGLAVMFANPLPRHVYSALVPPQAPPSGDYLDFEFDPEALAKLPLHQAEELRKALKAAKECCRHLRHNVVAWKTEQHRRIVRRADEMDAALSTTTARANAAFQRLLSSGERDALGPFLHACAVRQLVVRRCHARLSDLKAQQHRDLHDAQQRLHRAVKARLVNAASRAGFALPYQISSNLWATPIFDDDPEEDATGQQQGGLENSIGDVLICCEWCGRVLEGDGIPTGNPRWVCLDLPDTVRCEGCHAQLEHLKTVFQADLPDDLKRLVPSVAGCTFALESTCHYFLQDTIKHVDPAQDSPATFFARACVAYANRLALGFPDPEALPLEGSVARRCQNSLLAAAADMPLLLHDNFRWLTYGQLGVLSKRAAKHLLQLPGVSKGARIGICGYNTIEWAIAEFAIALIGCVPVGVHTTYDQPGAVHVINDAGLVALFVTKDNFAVPAQGGGEGDEPTSHSIWNVQTIAAMCACLKSCIVMDCTGEQVSKVDCGHLHAASMVDFVVPGASDKLPTLPNPEMMFRTDDTYTIFYTSGTSGSAPKGVVVPVAAFIKDIRSRVFVVPLITASYIPLSHTSDRMKLWEFLGNGGRVGFCFYGASNWIGHETDKKETMLRESANTDNNVLPLFKQIAALAPVGLACPPRIWSGLLAWYKAQLGQGQAEQDVRQQLYSMFGQRIKSLFTGGAPTSEEVVSWVRSCFPYVEFHDSYGATECGAICEDGYPMAEKGVEVALLDVPSLGFLVDDEPSPRGEIVVRSPSMCGGYLGKEDLTRESFLPGGWFRTGDLGTVTTEGSKGSLIDLELPEGTGETCFRRAMRVPPKRKLFVVERLSSVFSLADGTIVYPSKVEAALEQADGVQQAFVQGCHEENALVCLVVLAPDAGAVEEGELLRRFHVLAAEMRLAPCEVPRAARVVEPFKEQNGLLNGQLKKVRRKIALRYSAELEAMAQEMRDAAQPPPARCCEEHRLVYGPDTDVKSEAYQRLVRDSSGDNWAVLVAGETWTAMRPDKEGKRPGKYLGAHCSLENIGRAYAHLVDAFGRDRIIVIAQLSETLEWMEEATRSTQDCVRLTGTDSVLPVLTRKLAEMKEACGRLIADGGSDYDYELVNPDTVVRVLTGEDGPGFEKVVPRVGCGSLFLCLNSHGNCHRVSDDKSSPLYKKREWYLHLPYQSPPSRRSLYQFVSFASFASKEDHPDPAHLLYGKLLFYCFHTILQRAPFRRIVGLYQFCLSGGHSDFMELPSYNRYFNTHRWPVFLMLTSGPLQSSLGDFLPLWASALHYALAQRPDTTLQQLFQQVEEAYWASNAEVQQMNQLIRSSSAEEEAAELTFGEVQAFEGSQSDVGERTLASLFVNPEQAKDTGSDARQ